VGSHKNSVNIENNKIEILLRKEIIIINKYEYRGKAIEDGKWVYGDLIHEPYGTVIQDYITVYPKGAGAPERQLQKVRRKTKIDPETVGRFIYLCDEEKNKIYEDDVLLHDDSNWGCGGVYDQNNDGYLRTVVPSIECLLTDEYYEYNAYMFKNWKKIGNIHDNPELIILLEKNLGSKT